MSCEKKKSVRGSCTTDEDGYCDECGEEWPCDTDPVLKGIK